MAPWIPVTVVPTSFATVAIETFITELSSVIRNWPAASVSSTSVAPWARSAGAAAADVMKATLPPARPSQQRRETCERERLRAHLEPLERPTGRRDRLGRHREPLVELRCDLRRPKQYVDLEEPLQAPGLEVAGAREQLLPVPHECLRVQHRRMLQDADAGLEQARVMELLRGRTGPVVRVPGNEEPHAHAAACRTLDSPDHAAVGDVRVDHVQRVVRPVEQATDRVGDRPVSTGRVVQHDRRDRALALVEGRKERCDLRRPKRGAETKEAGEEDELELRDDGTGHAHEEVVEPAVEEVVLDARAPDPADAAVDDEGLAMVDVGERGQVPARRAACSERAGHRTC